MATTDPAIQLTFQRDGLSFSRTYHQSEAVQNVIMLGRLSSAAPDSRLPSWSENQREVGGYIVSPGRAAFVSPVMSRQHARLVFSPNEICISDNSHHGTYISRSGSTFCVDRCQALQTGDVITFGKTVHRRGQIYEPLSARVRMISAETIYQSLASYTGHGYSLPPNIHIDLDLEEDHDVYIDDDPEEHPSTHKYYAVQEVLEDDGGDIESIPSPVFPRGVDSKHDPLAAMPGGYDGLSEASSFVFGIPQSRLFELPPPMPGYPSISPMNPSLESRPLAVADAQTSLSILAPILDQGPAPLPPLLPPINMSRVHSVVPFSTHHEVIDVDEHNSEVIDVDAIGSPNSSVREISPYSGSDAESRRSSFSSSPSTPSFSPRQESFEDAENIKDVLKIVQELTAKLDKLLDYRSHSTQRIAANKAQLDTKIAALQQNVALLKSEIGTEHEVATSTFSKRVTDALEDIDVKKRAFIDDLNVYEDDVVYEVDRIMDRVDDLNSKMSEGNSRVDGYVESVKKLKGDLEQTVQVLVDDLKTTAAGATEQIKEVVSGIKRRRDELDDLDHPFDRARSPSVAMSMSPEPETYPKVEDTASRSIGAHDPLHSSVSESYRDEDCSLSSSEPPRKRQRVESMESTHAPRAGRVAGVFFGTAVAVCWALGKIGEMSTMTDF